MQAEYWNSFYAGRPIGIESPSQFAAFIASELQADSGLIEIGCGNGRDARFFSSLGVRVLAADASQEAIRLCRELSKSASVEFEVGSFDDSHIVDRMSDFFSEIPPFQRCVYARFFLHAITDDEESAFLSVAKELLKGGGVLAVEFRTDRDVKLSKVTAEHFRRFLRPTDFLSRAVALGFQASYFVEGFGFAKFRTDDAHVARLLLRADG